MRTRLLVAGAIIVALLSTAALAALMSRSDREDNDCAKVDSALRIALPARLDAFVNMPGHPRRPADPSQPDDEARAANDIRSIAATIDAPSLRARVIAIADDLEAMSRSRTAVVDPAAPPDKQFMGAVQDMGTSIHDLVKACPGIGDPAVSPP